MRYLGIVLAVSQVALAQTWCNKNYQPSQPVVPPGGNFVYPESSPAPLLSFRCVPAVKPYLAEDIVGAILIDTLISHSRIMGASPIALKGSPGLDVVVSVNGKTVARQRDVPLDATAFTLSFDLNVLKPRKETYNLSCTATYRKTQVFTSSSAFAYLPNPSGTTSVTKMDLRSGALLAKPANGRGGSYEALFPIGFYTSFGGYLAQNLSIIDELKEQGFNVIHPVPGGDAFNDNITAFNVIVDRMQEVGLYLMYDMRHSYRNTSWVTEQVNSLKSRPNLLLWYTADEPDGAGHALDETVKSYDLINDLDGYHPIALVLNCADYEFEAYASGTDIIMQDPYTIGNNLTFSTEWGTPCTVDYGDCGCDNCFTGLEDVATRLDMFKERMHVLGWERTKTQWSVPQAFGGESYWKRTPTGKEWLLQSILALNHGATGIMPWIDPTPPAVKVYASLLAKTTPRISSFLFHPQVKFQHLTASHIDVGLWTLGRSTLILATNLNYSEVVLSLARISMPTKNVEVLLDGGVEVVEDKRIVFESVGSGVFIVTF